MNLFKKSIKTKLMTLFMVVSLLPIVIVGFMSYISSKAEIKNQALSVLQAVGKSRVNDIKRLIQMRQEQAKELAGTFLVRQLESSGVNDPEDIAKIQTHIESILKEMQLPPRSGYETIDRPTAIAIISIWDVNGLIVANTDKDLIGQKMPDHFLQGVKSKGTFFGGFEKDTLTGKNFLIILQTVRDFEDEKFAGAVLLKVSAQILNEITSDRTGLGKSGKVYIVNKDYYMITESRFTDDAVLKQMVYTPTIRKSFAGEQTLEIYKDYRDIKIIGSSHLLKDQEWVLLAEIDESEAFASVRTLLYRLLLTVITIGILVGFIGYFSAISISKPIKNISALAVKVGKGDLTIEMYESTRSDEIGLLSNAFRKMVENLKKQINEISNGVIVLSSTVSDITATSSELAASSSENASSISETTTTIEELKQTAQVASEKAKEISESSKTTIQVANEGEKAVEATSVGMSRIQEQMESIAESIMKLSEQSQSIGDIMNSINDLAEQSNLLAVNASIEAAKAGEEGKGFSVVATEVKNLAEQSKQATQQVRGILTDIQKAISNAALATEEGNKVVEAGLKQSAEAGSSIKTLADVIEEAAQSTSQIAVSVQQQSVGIDQINEAIRNISTLSTQNLESTKQLESASLGLEELGNNLKKLMERYNVE